MAAEAFFIKYLSGVQWTYEMAMYVINETDWLEEMNVNERYEVVKPFNVGNISVKPGDRFMLTPKSNLMPIVMIMTPELEIKIQETMNNL